MQATLTYRTNRDLFSNHYLTDHLRRTEPWERVDGAAVRAAYEEIRDLWDDRRDRVADYNEAQLERNFVRPIFEVLGIPFEIEETVKRNARRPDYGFFASAEAADGAFDRADFYEEAVAVADAKRWDRKLDTRGEEKRDFENPSYQIHAYLQETPVRWAVLTNGRQWRLYYGPSSHRLDSYYEIDLPTLLHEVEAGGDLEDFKDFYCFFRREAFVPDDSGTCFLDTVYEESIEFAEALGADLQENIYEAIRVLAAGFLESNEDLGRDDLDLVHDSSLIYLYRLIFVLYAESEGRDLLPTRNEVYASSYGLNDLKREVVENRDATRRHYHDWQTTLWDRLDELFVLIDQGSRARGIPKSDLYVPAYNGGLFRTDPDEEDSAEARFLAGHEVGDSFLAEVVDLLTRREADEGEGLVFVDYSSLDERHLGSIYEGLLEYQLAVADEALTLDDGEYAPADAGDDVAVDAGEVYLRTDAGERKATGSYYTPEYVVEYIVDETLGPLVRDIQEDLLAQDPFEKDGGGQFAADFAERVFELKVLDPAMGSGHFLVNAVDYLAREIIDAQERQDQQAVAAGDEERISQPTTEEGELRDINWARRTVAQRCLYGVDLNPLATELAKVSLWLRTLAAEQPLAFLDHHLRCGNSLVGSDIEDVLGNGDDDAADDPGQLTLQESFDRTRQRALEHVMERFTDLLSIDNETLADVKEMEEVYADVREDDLYRHLLAMANVHTAAAFGLDVPTDAEDRLAAALRDDAWDDVAGQDWFEDAQALAAEERFFHWELEFPVAFYDEDGRRTADAGFDAVIGNPPYVRMEQIKPLKPFLSSHYSVHDSRVDLYAYFVEKSLSLTRGEYGVIVSNKWMKSQYGRKLRGLLSNYQVEQLIDFGDLEVFEGVSTYPCILIATENAESTRDSTVAKLDSLEFNSIGDVVEQLGTRISLSSLGSKKWTLGSNSRSSLKSSLDSNSLPLSEYLEKTEAHENIKDSIGRGVVTGGNDAFVVDEETRQQLVSVDPKSSEIIKPLLKGGDIHRYHISDVNRYLIYAKQGIAITEYPAIESHLSDYKDEIGATVTDEEWYELQQDQEEYETFFESPKICYPDIAKECSFAMDEDGNYLANTCYFIPSNSFALLGVLNSSPINWYYQFTTSEYRGGYQRSFTHAIRNLPIPPGIEGITLGDSDENIATLAKEATDFRNRRTSLNLNLLDYLGNYAEGPTLPDVGLFQPTDAGILDATAEEYENLRIGDVRTTRDGDRVTIEATARYKPADPDGFETDRWGYAETDYLDAFALDDLGDAAAALVEAFVPVAAEEGDGFAGFRDAATKTNSPLDRLKAMVLPDPDAVAADLDRYVEARERAADLDAKIEETDRLIDEIVYDLYGLSDEEIEIVEAAVAE